MRRLPLPAALVLLVVTAAQAGEPPADATIHFQGRTAAIGVGFTWGSATVQYQGQTYPVRVDGFVAGGIGTASGQGDGQIYGLRTIDDLNGDFTALATGATFGRGAGALVMRNDKGVRLVIDTTSSGLALGIGPRGITLEVGEAGGPPADASARLPQTLGFGEIAAGPLFLEPTLNAQMYYAHGHNEGFDGEWSFGPVDEANDWFEHSNEAGLNARYPIGPEGEHGSLLARVSGVYSMTRGGPDGPVCSSSNTNSEYTLESAYLAWKSGDHFQSLGHNAVELSAGNQNYQVFDGLLFWDGGQDCSNRGANWLSPRKAFRETAIARAQVSDFLLEAAHLKYNDDPSTDTRLGTARIEYATDDLFLEHLKLGLMYFHIYESETDTRDGMDGFYLYHEATPFSSLPGFTYKASFVREDNSESSGLTTAYGWYVGGAYELAEQPWQPKLGYRYASFSGGETRAFDSLFTGLPDWGYWFQGELLGEYVLSNSNLISHQVRLTLKPSDVVTVNLIYYKFLLDHREQGFGVTPERVGSHSLADEVDLIVDIALTNWWSITATLAVAHPSNAFQEAVDGSSTWVNGYLYTNFNF